jgi:CheY-like chemotaxis protein
MSYQLSRLRILIIDDNQPIRLLIRSLLMDLGVGFVDVADNGRKGWDMFTSNPPDLIVVDWRMNDGNGLEFTRRVRKDPLSPQPHIPIIMTTGFTNKERVFQARDAGVTEFLIKPFTVQNLSRHLTHVIENPRKFVMSSNFTGPDRRRREQEVDAGKKKRQSDNIHEAEDSAFKKSDNYIDLRGGHSA